MLFFTLNPTKSQERLRDGAGLAAQKECGSRQVVFAMRIRTAAERKLSGADAARVASKSRYDVALVEFWQENVDKPEWHC
jgi:hypothetical protein